MAAAEAAGQAPDVFYAFSLLEETGICVIPGSGCGSFVIIIIYLSIIIMIIIARFGQQAGTFHFRTTILPQEAMIRDMLDRLASFQASFLDKYRS